MDFDFSFSTPLFYAGAALAVVTAVAWLGLFRGGKNNAFLTGEKQELVLLDKTLITHNSFRLRFGLENRLQSLGLPVGKHLELFAPNVKGKVEGTWNGKKDLEIAQQDISRKYTPVTGEDCAGFVDFVIKAYRPGEKEGFPDGGKCSNYLGNLKEGDSVTVKGPIGRVAYLDSGVFEIDGIPLPTKKKIGLIAGGTGITPMLQLVHSVVESQVDTVTQLSLIFANDSEEDILCRVQLEEVAALHPKRFRCWNTLRNPSEGWAFGVGLVSESMIREHLFPPAEDTVVCICGPPPMNVSVKSILLKIGHEKESIIMF